MVLDGELQVFIVSKISRKNTQNLSTIFSNEIVRLIEYCRKKRNLQCNYTMSDFDEFTPYIIYDKRGSKNEKDILFLLPPGSGGAESYLNNIVPKIDNKKLVLFNNYMQFYIHKFGKDYACKHFAYENLASEYIPYIQAIQLGAPYNLFGWSFGGILAFELALQLAKQGCSIANIVLVDSYFNMKRFSKEAAIYSNHIKSDINYNYNPVFDEKLLSNTNIIL
jgi:pimeloyl-ACP methyl ester carboxylesterase